MNIESGGDTSRKSVRELRSWLYDFQNQQKDHFQKSRVFKKDAVKSRIKQFETAPSLSSSTSQSSESVPNGTKGLSKSNTNDPALVSPIDSLHPTLDLQEDETNNPSGEFIVESANPSGDVDDAMSHEFKQDNTDFTDVIPFDEGSLFGSQFGNTKALSRVTPNVETPPSKVKHDHLESPPDLDRIVFRSSFSPIESVGYATPKKSPVPTRLEKPYVQNEDDTGEEDYRITSIKRLLEMPAPRKRRESATQDTLVTSWYPDAHGAWLLDDKRKTRSVIGEHDFDNKSTGTGHFTDPGGESLGRRLTRRLTMRLRKSPKAESKASPSSPSKVKRRNLLPAFLQKTRVVEPHHIRVHTPPPKTTAFDPFEMSDDADRAESSNRSKRMHNSNFVQSRTLPNFALDFLCNESSSIPEIPESNQNNFPSDGSDSLTWSNDSESPSINHDAIDAKLSDMFGQEASVEDGNVPSPPKLHSFSDDGPTKGARLFEEPFLLRRAEDKKEKGKVAKAIEKLGPPAKSAIQMRQEELQKKWAMDRKPTVVGRNHRWEPCKSAGKYKRKVTLKLSDEA